MSPAEHERTTRLAAKIAAALDRQRRLMARAELLLKEAERRLRPERRVRA